MDMKKYNFTILGIPQPKQSARFRIAKSNAGKNFIMSYQNKEVVQNEQSIKAIVISQLPNGFIPLAGPIAVTKLKYVFPPLKSFTKGEKKLIDSGIELLKHTKPDLTDNLQKAIFDSLQGVLYLNDSQVCRMDGLEKVYGSTPRIELELVEIN
jgi:Holliday junction resolvase RusA-like endonuclease